MKEALKATNSVSFVYGVPSFLFVNIESDTEDTNTDIHNRNQSEHITTATCF